MKRLLATSLMVVLAMAGPPPAASAAETGLLTVTVLNSDGTPSQGQKLRSVFLETSFPRGDTYYNTDSLGRVSFELPEGPQEISARFVPDSDALNVSVSHFQFSVNIAVETKVEIRLPRVLETTATLKDETGRALVHAPLQLSLGNCNASNISVSNSVHERVLRSTAIRWLHKDSEGVRTVEVSNRPGIRANNGKATIAVFTDYVDCQSEPTFSSRMGFSFQDVPITNQEFTSGNLAFVFENAPTFKIDTFSQISDINSNTNTSKFVLTGNVSYANGFTSNTFKNLFISRPTSSWIKGLSIGENTLSMNGDFRMVIYVNTTQLDNVTVFYLDTDLGQSELLNLPKFMKVAQKTLSMFSGNLTSLNSQQKSQIKASLDASPNADKFICTGIRYFSQPASVNIMVRKRAKEACEYAKLLRPGLSTWYQNKPTQARSYAGKVLLTAKSQR
jgi:hypothetical protein